MNKNRLQLFFGFLIVIAIVVWAASFSKFNADSSSTDKIYFLNVGQGDSEYIKLRDGKDILIDGGPDQKVLEELGKVMDFNDRRIDLVVLTHPHADHLTGLIDVVNRYEIGQVWESGVVYPSKTYDKWQDLLKQKNIPDSFVSYGQEKSFNNSATKFKVIYPLSTEKNLTIDNLNDSSVVTELDDGKFSSLFLGDSEKTVQIKYLDKLQQITVLKVGHHGSQNGTLEDLLQITRPAIAVIEVGKNTYGHPAASTLNLLKQYAIQIYRTDQNGTVEVDFNSTDYSVKENQ